MCEERDIDHSKHLVGLVVFLCECFLFFFMLHQWCHSDTDLRWLVVDKMMNLTNIYYNRCQTPSNRNHGHVCNCT